MNKIVIIGCGNVGMSYAYSQELRDLPIYNFEEKVLSLDK